MKSIRVAFVGVLFAGLVGCIPLQSSTDEAPGWVKTLDKVLAVQKDAQGNVTHGSPVDPTGGTVPIAGTALGIAGLVWYAIRRIAGSVPAEVHAEAVKGLATSTPQEPKG